MQKYNIEGFKKYLIDDEMNIYNAKTGKKIKQRTAKDTVSVTLYDDFLKRVNRTPYAFYKLKVAK